VNVNAVTLGYTESPMVESTVQGIAEKYEDQSVEGLRASWAERSPQGRAVPVAEIADAIAFLATEGANSMNGHEVVLDGGELA